MVGPQLVELAPRMSPAADLGHAALEAGLVAAGVVGEQVPAPGRAILLARQGLILAQLGRTADAAATVEAASRNTADNRFEADLLVGLRVASDDRRALGSMADRGAGSDWSPAQRAQARIALGDLPGALEVLEEAVTAGWHHARCARDDWNSSGLGDDPRFREPLGRS